MGQTIKNRKNIEIQLVRLSEVRGKVLSDINPYKSVNSIVIV